MTWEIWLVSVHTGDRKELVASYSNRGHAIAKLRGLMHQTIASEMTYAIRQG